jgi:hypothetical protein
MIEILSMLFYGILFTIMAGTLLVISLYSIWANLTDRDDK